MTGEDDKLREPGGGGEVGGNCGGEDEDTIGVMGGELGGGEDTLEEGVRVTGGGGEELIVVPPVLLL